MYARGDIREFQAFPAVVKSTLLVLRIDTLRRERVVANRVYPRAAIQHVHASQLSGVNALEVFDDIYRKLENELLTPQSFTALVLAACSLMMHVLQQQAAEKEGNGEHHRAGRDACCA